MAMPSLAYVACLFLVLLAPPGADAMALGGLPKVDPEFAPMFDDTEVVKIKSPMLFFDIGAGKSAGVVYEVRFSPWLDTP